MKIITTNLKTEISFYLKTFELLALLVAGENINKFHHDGTQGCSIIYALTIAVVYGGNIVNMVMFLHYLGEHEDLRWLCLFCLIPYGILNCIMGLLVTFDDLFLPVGYLHARKYYIGWAGMIAGGLMLLEALVIF